MGSSDGKDKNDGEEKIRRKENTKRDTIPLQVIQNEKDEVAEEMQKIFDEDKVVHRHGSSEPESD